ncbi:MAG: alpha/beta hydrolase [Acidimicrobiia bacterium]|jgi:3-oxoadipate enol-lactonase/4-carboxymuconolactone decarboxylase
MSETTSTQTIDCGGRDAVVEVVGSGHDVVLVGAAAPMAWTRPTARSLSRLGCRVVNFDYGFGHPNPEPRTAIRQIDDVVAVMEALQLRRATVVGVSRGGITAFGLASAHPQRVTSLALVFAVAAFPDTLMVGNPDLRPEPGESDDDFMHRSLKSVFSERFLEQDPDIAVSLMTTPPGAVARVNRDQEMTFDEDARVTCPTLVIEGGADEVVTTEHAQRFMRAIPEAEHVRIPDAPHGWPMERPNLLAGLIADFARSSDDW